MSDLEFDAITHRNARIAVLDHEATELKTQADRRLKAADRVLNAGLAVIVFVPIAGLVILGDLIWWRQPPPVVVVVADGDRFGDRIRSVGPMVACVLA